MVPRPLRPVAGETAEFGFSLAPAAQRQGYATEAAVIDSRTSRPSSS